MPPLDNSEFESPVPPAVRRASKRSDEIARELGVANVPEDVPVDPPVDPPADPPVDPPVDPPADPPADPPVEDWEQKARTAEGRVNSQGNELRELRAQIASLHGLIADMQHQPAPAPAATTTAVDVPQEEIEAYGADLIRSAQGWARSAVQSELDALRAELQQLRGGQQQLTQDNRQERVFASLDADKEIGGVWRQINDYGQTPEFKTWIEDIDPFAGKVRLELLTEAASRGDAARCARFYKAFIAEHSVTTQPPAALPGATTTVVDRPTLESMAAPGRAAGSGGPGGAPAEKRVWTRAEISAFYRECTAGRYLYREQDKARIEADIIAAIPEGRLRN